MNWKLLGRGLFTANALAVGVGGLRADWNATHLFNPRWPPHAKFHDAQTMAAGVVLGLTSLFFAWRRAGDPATNVLAAAVAGCTLWQTQLAANFFPETAWTDPEFLGPGQSLQQVSPLVPWDLGATGAVLLAAWLCWPRKPVATAVNARGSISGNRRGG